MSDRNRMSRKTRIDSQKTARSRSLRLAVLALSTLALVAGLGPGHRPIAQGPGPCDPPNSNPVVCENLLLGNPDTEWDISGAGDSSIQGFTTDISVDQGQTVSFKIDTNASAYRLDIYRMGYYNGLGARKVAAVNPSAALPQNQPDCLSNAATGLIDCGNWAVSASWTVPSTAVSGIYFAKAIRLDTGGASHIVFVVRDDDSHADLLLQTSDTTWQAYNQYGGNSLYVGGPGTSPGRAYKVSYNRPFTTRETSPEDWVFNAEYPMVRWLEASGYNVSYSSGIDSDRRGSELLEHKVFLSVGHDEYWSGAQRTNVEAARAAGVDLAFFSGNEVFWKTRWENSLSSPATAHRTLVSYKETHANAKIDPQTNVWTGSWRDPRFSPPADGGRPENGLTGTIFAVNSGTAGIRVPAAEGKMRFWRNTAVAALAPGGFADLPNGTLGYEWDEDRDNGFRPAGLIRMSDTTVSGVDYLQDHGSTYGPGTANHALTLYKHSSGALVFGGGTVQWSWGLDSNHDRGSAAPNSAMQQATVNLFADMGAQPLTLQPGLLVAGPSTDTVAPTSTIVSPANGAGVPANTTITISGTATDSGGGVVGGVEISVDGGTTWRRATGRANWTFTWPTGSPRTVTIFSRAVDDSGNLASSGTGASVTVGSGSVTCPCSIWAPSQTPAVPNENDPSAIEVGTRFRADVSGFITAIRFYKGSQNVGAHVGNLWTAGGTLLATVPFSGEAASGWQQMALPSPVAITANTSYVVSYHTTSGFYSGDDGYFASSGVVNGPLQALRDGFDGPNGVYRYGATGFPTQTYQSENYWADIVFVTSIGPDTTPPQVTSVTPPAGSSAISTATSVTATFSENVNASTITSATFELRGPGSTLVASTLSYASGSNRATLQPTSSLATSTTYTATVRGGLSGVKDTAGNSLPADVIWSFTTGTSGGPACPCSIWNPTQIPSGSAEVDPNAVEVGTRFRSDASGYVTAIRFYKHTQNVGPHVGNVWTSGGTLLGSVPFSGETASGWQEMTLPSPVPVAANTSYVVSYHTASGNYAGEDNYFASAGVVSGPLQALRDGFDGPNGVYKYGATGFPTQTYQSENYWVDLVFVSSIGPDTTPPQVTGVSPAAGASGIATNAAGTATFSENVNASTVTTSTFELRDAGNVLVPAAVSYSAGTRTATLQPSAALANSVSYTATVKGGASGVKDGAGNALASDYSWSFTTAAPPPPPPNEGPGGPILVVGSSANPFTRYYAEILRAEGLNAFTATDISLVTAGLLTSYDIVILGEMPLTTAQVTMFTNWVTGGGNLIAMRPDKKLASLLGLTDVGTTLPEGYLLVNTSAAPGTGIVGQTMQFHGTADRYTMAGATTVATLYSNGSTATTNPAVTVRSVGTSGGQAAAFTYDLARSIVYTRQGNPAWSGQERDGVAPIRSDDLFFGGSAPNWVDLTKVAIPQADEQQRLLANLVGFMNLDRKPLPRFWYFPRGLKAVIVMTGDDHGNNGTAGRFDIYNSNSPTGCNVADWACVRATSYIYPNTPIGASQAAAYVAQGFEIAVHITTLCGDYTPASLEATYVNDLSQFAAIFPGVPAPQTNRTHCIAWSDYTSQAEIAFNHGIRLDTNYYYWPPTWVNDVPGMFTGSGMPMRFAKADGTIIDVYQATTQMTDESGQTYPFNSDTLLNRALGPEGYYGAFTTNMHTDMAAHAGSVAIVASAQARGVPVISSKQLLTWLDGRNGSAFGGLSWAGTTLSFTVSVGAGANGLQALVPANSAVGALTGITRNGSAISYSVQTLKGVSYAVFSATAGSYQAQYAIDTVPPVVSALNASAGTTAATITWTTDEAATSRVDYGTSASALTSTASAPGLGASHSVALTGLTPGTQYFYRATSADGAGNSTSAPASPASFTTATAPPPAGPAVTDTTVTDFGAGTPNVGIYVSETGNGEVQLRPTVGAEFTGTQLPLGWTATAWNAGGAATVSGGQVLVDGASFHTDAFFGPGASLEFTATFNGAAFQHAGLGLTLGETPWAIFSTGDGGALYSRTHNGATPTDTLIAGPWLNTPHRYRIDWTASSVVFSIDGTPVATHTVTIAGTMRPVVSDFDAGGGGASVDWMRLSPIASSGSLLSRILDAGTVASWATATWTSTAPAGTTIALSARFGNTPTPDGTWTGFSLLPASGTSLTQTSRYVQYQADLASTDPAQTPVLQDITFASAISPVVPAISVADVSITEGNSGSSNAGFVVSLSAATTQTVTVNYATANGTAAAPGDYTAGSGTLTFAPGSTSQSVTVPVLGDTLDEANETFVVNLSSATNATIADTQGLGTITDNDAAPSLVINNVTLTEGNTGTANATFTVTLSAASGQTVTVSYATANGTATSPADFTAVSGTLTFAAATTTQTITVPVVGDTLDEANETFVVNLSGATNATIADNQGAGTITDNDATPSLVINNVTVTEGNSGTTNAIFTVTLSATSGQTVTVNYATANGTAVAPADYTTRSGTLTFTPGTTTQTITVPVVGDTLDEANETFVVNLSGATNATIADNQGVGTITDNDATPSLVINNVSITEGNSSTSTATFTVTLSAASGQTVTVNFATANGTATAGSDYVARTGTLTFAAGVTTQTIAVTVNGDTTAEANETFVVNLSGATNATIADTQGVGTINNND
jgi:hypothetical protein